MWAGCAMCCSMQPCLHLQRFSHGYWPRPLHAPGAIHVRCPNLQLNLCASHLPVCCRSQRMGAGCATCCVLRTAMSTFVATPSWPTLSPLLSPKSLVSCLPSVESHQMNILLCRRKCVCVHIKCTVTEPFLPWTFSARFWLVLPVAKLQWCLSLIERLPMI